MTAAHRRGAALEQRTAEVLGTRRVRRAHFGEIAPDVEPVRLACGLTLSVECKKRKALPALLRDAIAQARKYLPHAVPVVVIAATGGEPFAVLPLEVLAQLAGVRELIPPNQAPLLLAGRT